MGGSLICFSYWCVEVFVVKSPVPHRLVQEVNNVLVIVTRYFGGIHLGPDRFKHINQAARNALEAGGFLDTPETNGKKPGARAKKH